MPTISLRLTEQEHAALKGWAHGSHRSMQREAVYRIFQERSEVDASRRDSGAEPIHHRSGATTEVNPVQFGARPAVADTHFKPDFK